MGEMEARYKALNDALDAINRRIARDEQGEGDGWLDGMEEAWNVVHALLSHRESQE